MSGSLFNWSDSPVRQGGTIPGVASAAAFTLTLPEPSAIPVLIAVPHAGRTYPRNLLDRMRNPGFAALRLEDRFVDKLAVEAARICGAGLLVAHAPRAMVDLNRDEDDIDWEMFARGAPDRLGSYTPGRRARNGLGLIPRRLPGLGELWKRRHDEEDLVHRLDEVHRPYHTCLAEALASLRERWGAALLIDLHSMPPIALASGQPAPHFVLGDRFGAACEGRLVGSCFEYLGSIGRKVAHNRPYAGGYVLERHAAPDKGIHALQLEIDRSCYLDSRLDELGSGFDETVELLVGMVRRMADEVAELGRASGAANWPLAAE